MGKKNKKKKASASNKGLSKEFVDRKPVLRFLGIFGVSLVLFYILYYSSFYDQYLKDTLLNIQASLASGILNVFGYGSKVSGDQIYTNDFNIRIAGGCDGVEATALFILAIVAFPVNWRSKMVGIAAGVVTLFIVNLIRIVGLFVVGTHYYSSFEFFHLHGGVVLFTIFSVLIWILWANWSMVKLKTV